MTTHHQLCRRLTDVAYRLLMPACRDAGVDYGTVGLWRAHEAETSQMERGRPVERSPGEGYRLLPAGRVPLAREVVSWPALGR